MTATLTREVRSPRVEPARDRACRSGIGWFVAAIVLVVSVWGVSLTAVHLRAMDDTGLVSVLPWTALAALGLLVVSFGLALSRPQAPSWLLALHVGVLVVLLYATPPLLEGTLRYSWAWKHVGIVDYIDRTGGVDPDIETLGVYHNWPGFFAFNAWLTRAAGFDSALSYATWATPFFNLLTVAGVAGVLRALTNDRSVIALGSWIFVLANWIGQGYFAPQAVSFLWYLVVLAILLRWFPGSSLPDGDRPLACPPAQRAGLMAVVLLLLLGIVSTHPLTPIVTVLVLGALAALRQTSARTLPLITAALTAYWLLFVAAPFTGKSLAEALGVLGDVGGNLDGTLLAYGQASSGQVLVSLMSRALTGLVLLLAVLGGLRCLRRGPRDPRPIVLAAVPFGILAISPYGHEVLFRAYLFALPGLVFYAARLLLPRHTARDGRLNAGIVVGVSGVLLVGFLFAQFGNERQYYFTRPEVAAAE
ncbi:MAG: glycosyltransferase, partial [Acidimicrobiales bacterium]